MKFPRTLLFALLPVLLAGCPAGGMSSVGVHEIGSDERPGSLSGLITGSVITPAEQEVRDIQTRETATTFPVKMGLIYYGYQSPLKAEDGQAAFKAMRTALLATGNVKDVFQIPNEFVKGGGSIDPLRKLAARFQADVLLLVSGDSTLEPADVQTRGFFDFFSNKVDYEARTTLSGLALDVYAGTFLQPVNAATKSPVVSLDSTQPGYVAERYALQKGAASDAFKQLSDALAKTLADRRAEVEKK